ncbi:MAG: outer membrane beta-barrel protein [Bacteroidota bacterium]
MKKILTVLLMVVAVHAQAQRGGGNNDPRPFGWSGDGMGNHIPTLFGLSGGVSVSNVGGYGTMVAPTFSVFMGVPVTSTFRIRPEIGYAAMGSSNATTSFRTNYFLLPVLASFEINKGLFLLAGPQTAMILSANQTTGSIKTNTRDQMHVQDLSLVGGMEYMPGKFGVAVRYQYGLTNNGLGNYNRGLRAGINIKF